ncbi:MAG: DUF523 and DUF1722 domain-containing protein [Syntrophorhabdales bacterium]
MRLGISACLTGEKTRYDGRHKLDPFLVETLGRYVRFVPVCPEVEAGLGVPREAMRLDATGGDVRLVTVRTGRDMTPLVEQALPAVLDRLEKEDLWGFIFKSRSPSCGPVAAIHGPRRGTKGRGVFARLFHERFPLLPAEDEGRLRDPDIREDFIGRMFTLKRWRDLVETGMDRPRLTDFHTRHKLLMLSRSRSHYREMGRLVAASAAYAPKDLFLRYRRLLLGGLTRRATVSKHVFVLSHIMGYFKKRCTADELREMEEKLAAFRAGLVPLGVPLARVHHYARKYKVSYLEDQFYVNPHPAEVMLLYHS